MHLSCSHELEENVFDRASARALVIEMCIRGVGLKAGTGNEEMQEK